MRSSITCIAIVPMSMHGWCMVVKEGLSNSAYLTSSNPATRIFCGHGTTQRVERPQQIGGGQIVGANDGCRSIAHNLLNKFLIRWLAAVNPLRIRRVFPRSTALRGIRRCAALPSARNPACARKSTLLHPRLIRWSVIRKPARRLSMPTRSKRLRCGNATISRSSRTIGMRAFSRAQ